MNEITKLKPIPRWETPTIDRYPIVNQQGIDYQLVPISLIQKLRNDRECMIWFAVGLSLLTIASLIGFVFAATRPATEVITVDKPVVVEKQVVVPTNCILFCGK